MRRVRVGTPAGKTIGTLEIELFDEVSPLTAENFRVLCGVGSKEDAIPTFKGTRFHRIIPRFMIQGGDVTRGDGTGACVCTCMHVCVCLCGWRVRG